jgi:hypothetical protein
LRGRGYGLAEHLATEDRAPAEILAAATKQIAVESFETEEIDERGEDGLHTSVGTMCEPIDEVAIQLGRRILSII